jgi:hypothetical protein
MQSKKTVNIIAVKPVPMVIPMVLVVDIKDVAVKCNEIIDSVG